MDLRLDMSTHDLDLTGHDLNPVTPEEQIGQFAWLRLRTQRGSYAFAQGMGIPHREFAVHKPARLDVVEAVVREQLLSVTGVTGIADITTEYDATTRALSGSAVLETDYGLVSVSAA